MVFGIGVDIEKISRFKEAPVSFLKSIFTEKEITYCNQKKNPFKSFAGKFCAKEAVIKAHGKKMLMRDIEILFEENNKIKVYIQGKHKKEIGCSISHTDENAVAYVLIEK